LLIDLLLMAKLLSASGLNKVPALVRFQKPTTGARVSAHKPVFHMGDSERSAQIVRFGVFEADLQTGELRKNGVRVPLQGQPFQVCALLLKHSGELVTREELRQNVWPEDTLC
jgi:DNA-binding response OmpR family regulator